MKQRLWRKRSGETHRLFHGKHRAQFVIDQHHGDQNRVRPEGGFQIGQSHGTALVRHEIRHLIALLLQTLQRLQNRCVFNGGGDDMPPSTAVFGCSGCNCPVIPLRSAGGEHNLLRPAAQRLRHTLSVLLQPLCPLCAEGIAGGGVSVSLRHHLHRCLNRSGTDRGSGGIVQIGVHNRSSFLTRCIHSQMLHNTSIGGRLIARQPPRKSKDALSQNPSSSLTRITWILSGCLE